jgi:DinB family protein
MSETVQQYTTRLAGLVGDRDPLAVMGGTPGRLQALVSGASAEELRWTSAPERWTIGQIAAHITDAEIVGAWRFRAVLAEDAVALQAYDQNAWASAFRYENAPADESVGLFVALRHATLRVLRQVDPARLRHAGMHAERGRESVERLTLMYAGHDLNHLAQIERLLSEARLSHP